MMAEDRLIVSTYKDRQEICCRDMDYFQPVVFKPPKWLIIFTWFAALSAKGPAKAGAAGRAMILSGSESGSIGIRLKNGSDLFINITDQMGNTALKGFEQLLNKLKDRGVREKDEIREIRSLGLETVKLPDK